MVVSWTIRDIIASFFRQFRIILVVFILCVAVGVFAIVSSTVLYQSTGSLLVKFGADANTGINRNDTNPQISPNDRREVIQSNIEILQSNDLLKSVLNKVGVERVYEGITDEVGDSDLPADAALRRLERKHLTVKAGQQSNIIDISVMNKNPEVAAEIVATMQDMFIAKQLEIFNKPQTEFLEEQLKLASAKLAKSQQKLDEFKNAAEVSSIEAELAELLKQKNNAATVAYQSVDNAQARLAELKDREIELLATYKSDSPALKAVRNSIAEAKKQLAEKQDNTDATKNDSVLSKQLVQIDKRIRKLEKQRSRYNDLLRDVQNDETNYKNYLAKSEEARINESLGKKKITSISIVDEPDVPVKPARPRKLLILAISVLAGAVLGGLLAFVREVMDQRFRNPQQLASTLKLPVLANLPSQGGVMQLYNNVEHMLSDVPQPIIQFISSYEGEGAESVAQDLTNLAKNQGKNVLLINTDELRQNFQQAHFEFASRYNNSWTIVPTPAVMNNELGQSIAKQASGSIFVVEAERTRAPVAKEVKKTFSSLGGKIIGSVLVGRKLYIPKWLYNIIYRTDR